MSVKRTQDEALQSALACLECVICKRMMIDPHRLPCAHNFCRCCIEQALDDRCVCPSCGAHSRPSKLRRHLRMGDIIAALTSLTAPATSTESTAPPHALGPVQCSNTHSYTQQTFEAYDSDLDRSRQTNPREASHTGNDESEHTPTYANIHTQDEHQQDRDHCNLPLVLDTYHSFHDDASCDPDDITYEDHARVDVPAEPTTDAMSAENAANPSNDILGDVDGEHKVSSPITPTPTLHLLSPPKLILDTYHSFCSPDSLPEDQTPNRSPLVGEPTLEKGLISPLVHSCKDEPPRNASKPNMYDVATSSEQEITPLSGTQVSTILYVRSHTNTCTRTIVTQKHYSPYAEELVGHLTTGTPPFQHTYTLNDEDDDFESEEFTYRPGDSQAVGKLKQFVQRQFFGTNHPPAEDLPSNANTYPSSTTTVKIEPSQPLAADTPSDVHPHIHTHKMKLEAESPQLSADPPADRDASPPIPSAAPAADPAPDAHTMGDTDAQQYSHLCAHRATAKLPCVCVSAVPPNTLATLQRCQQMGLITSSVDVSEGVTHVVMPIKRQGYNECTRSMKYLKGLLKGAKIVSDRWLEACLYEGRLVSEDEYSFVGTTRDTLLGATGRAREDLLLNGRSTLLNGLRFAFHAHCFPGEDEADSDTHTHRSNKAEVTLPHAVALIMCGGGSLYSPANDDALQTSDKQHMCVCMCMCRSPKCFTEENKASLSAVTTTRMFNHDVRIVTAGHALEQGWRTMYVNEFIQIISDYKRWSPAQ